MKNKYPIYIPSKSRANINGTAKALDRMGVEYHVIVEEQELSDYLQTFKRSQLLILPEKYQRDYEFLLDLGISKSLGAGPARNFAWDHSTSRNASRHWTIDDNILDFYRFNENRRIRVYDGAFFRVMEDFVDRYTNVAIAGPAYRFFVPDRAKKSPITLNTRIYSCQMIRNNLPFRWRSRYNEDTVLSLDALKLGFCTIQFNCWLQDKAGTQTRKGGCNSEFYEIEGTLPKSEGLVRLHPDVTKLVKRFNRWHHYVDYRPFKKNKLKRKRDVVLSGGVNEYGLRLKNRG